LANTIKKVQAALTTSLADIYTPGAGVEAVIFDGTVANIDTGTPTTEQVTAEVEVSDGSTTYTDILVDVDVPPKTSLRLPKQALTQGESFRAKASANSKLEIVMSILEIT